MTSRSATRGHRNAPAPGGAAKPVCLAARQALLALAAASAAAAAPTWAQTAASDPKRDDATLSVVKVKARKETASTLPQPAAGGQVGSGARMGLLGNQDVMDTPFNITSYTAELIADQQAKTVADVLNNDPSVRFTTSGSHSQENLRLRGFDFHNADLAINGMYGLAPLGSSTLEFVERVEVLKGPSAMFTGMAPSGGIGGVINLVPKRAGDEPLTRVTLGYESARQLSTGVDIGRRFGEDKAFGVRVNASYGDGETALDGQDKQRHFLSAALDYRSSALTASVDVYDSKLAFDGGSAAMYGFATTSIPSAPNPRLNYLKSASGELKNRAAIARAEVAFSRDITGFASLGTRKYDYSGWINGTHAHSVQADGSALVRGVAQLGYDDGTSAELGARMNVNTLGVRHEMVLQATRLGLEAGSLSNVTSMQATNIYNPITPTLPAMPSGAVPKGTETTLSSLALVDTLSFLNDALRLTLGLRQQQVEQTSFNTSTGAITADYDKKAMTPSVAVVFKPWGDGVSLYANYVEGLSQGMNYTALNGYAQDQLTTPYKSKQKELGGKWRTGDFTNTVSLFEITQPTVVIDYSGGYGAWVASDDNKMRVRGLEWSSSGKVLPTVSLLGGISYTKGVLTQTWNGQNEGHEIFGVPNWQGNIGLQWDTPLSGLSLSSRVIATSGLYLNNANTHQIPGWGQLDLGAAYSTRLSDRKLVLRLNVDNALDHHYWSGSFAEPRATLAQGRIVRASATMDF